MNPEPLEIKCKLADLSYKTTEKPAEFKVKVMQPLSLDELLGYFGGTVTLTLTLEAAMTQEPLPFDAKPDPGPHEFRALLSDDEELTSETPCAICGKPLSEHGRAPATDPEEYLDPLRGRRPRNYDDGRGPTVIEMTRELPRLTAGSGD